MKYSTHYGLQMPEENDFYDVENQNHNMREIDGQLYDRPTGDEVAGMIQEHAEDTTAHITAAERTAWNGKANANLDNVSAVLFQQKVGMALNGLMTLRGRFASGEYKGDGEESKTIKLGWKPAFVLVVNMGGSALYLYNNETFYGGIASQDLPHVYQGLGWQCDIVRLTDNGFKVACSADTGKRVRTNESGYLYRYFAIG